MVKYSQRDEQDYILAAVGGTTGRFLDIGAWHPKTFSNTRALYDRGWWSGVLVEPSPGPMQELLKEYGECSRVRLVQAAVAEREGLQEFYISDDGVTTSSSKMYRRWKDAGVFYGKVLIPTVTWETLLDTFGYFDFVNIDAEGASADLFLRLIDIVVKGTTHLRRLGTPRCCCVETDGRADEVKSVAESVGYSVTYASQENLVLVRD